MKIIISHDVDHLYVWDHLKRDLIIEKLWVRSFIHFIQEKISFRTFIYRLLMPFHNKMHRIDEVMEFDKNHGIPSIFFFGMENDLGMSYYKEQAFPLIKRVMSQSFDVGVHGINYQETAKIRKEHDDFSNMSGLMNFGIRNHYVRFDEETLKKQEEVGYLFDSTWFDKKKLNIKEPYKVGNMWEFPLHIMDCYICKEGEADRGIKETIKAIEKAESMEMPYCTILFHDYQFDDNYFPQMKKWYVETINYCKERGYSFISYRDAIEEMEEAIKELEEINA